MISVYNSTETEFATNGIKILKPLKALVHLEDNGDFYVDLKDTIDNLDYYQSGMIIRVNTPWGYQGFRVSDTTIENKNITCRAKHLYFDGDNYIIKDSYVVDKNCNDALDHLNSATDKTSPFKTLSDVTTIASFRCVRKSLTEAFATVVERWGGHLKRDNFNVEVRNTIGSNNGVVLAYAKNIENIKAEEDWSEVVTKILPVGKDGILLPEIYIELDEELYDIPYSKVVSFTQDDIDEQDYTDEDGNLDEDAYNEALITDLRSQAEKYLEENKLPKVNYSLSAYLKEISDVGDIIRVKHPKCKIDISTSVISIDYDAIHESYTNIEFGNFKNKLKDLFSKVSADTQTQIVINNDSTVAKLESELESATNQIRSAMGDSYVIYDGDKILIVDTLPKENAKNCILINNGGIGFSNTGINGTFSSAWTIDGTFNMQNINVINLVADMIKGGTLKLGSNENESGQLELYDESNKLICELNKSGLTFYNDDNSYIKINPVVGFAGYDSSDNKTYWVDGDEFHMKKSVVEEEITFVGKARIIPITTDTNDGIGFVAVV